VTIKPSLVISAVAILISLPCEAGPCSDDIERMQFSIDAKMNAVAAAGPAANQDVEAQMHRQPTPGSLAQTESKLGEVSSRTIKEVKDAMTRAREADIAGNKAACEQALADVQRVLGP
jgi:hypothetical protein